MKSRIVLSLLALFIAAGSAHARFSIGLAGALYSDTQLSLHEIGDGFANGEGIYYGPFVEFSFGNLGLGASFFWSVYSEDWSVWGYPNRVRMVNYDGAIYLQGHLFGPTQVVNPFLESGFGIIGKDFADDADDPDPQTPLQASTYWYIGAGLGLNFGPLGTFIKMLYNMPFAAPVQGRYTIFDEHGNAVGTGTYDLASFPIRRFKVLIGGKVNF